MALADTFCFPFNDSQAQNVEGLVRNTAWLAFHSRVCSEVRVLRLGHHKGMTSNRSRRRLPQTTILCHSEYINHAWHDLTLSVADSDAGFSLIPQAEGNSYVPVIPRTRDTRGRLPEDSNAAGISELSLQLS